MNKKRRSPRGSGGEGVGKSKGSKGQVSGSGASGRNSYKKKGGKKKRKNELHRTVIRVLKESDTPLAHKNIIRKLSHVASGGKVMSAIRDLVDSGKILETPSNKLRLPDSKRERMMVTGTVDMTAKGSAFVVVPGMENDVFVPQGRLNRAFDGDTVRVMIRRRRHRGKIEGEVIDVLKRAKDEYIGTLRLEKGYGFVLPLQRTGMRDIFISNEELQQSPEARDGDRVAVRITEWPAQIASPRGRITKVLGRPEENDTEMVSILLQAGFPVGFSEEVMKEAKAWPAELEEEEIQERRDVRDIITFTIDPEDAKDFDDALSVRALDEGRYEIGVHIADVSYYVREGSKLDKEAFKRATSVYLVDRVNPMLPERLSNGLCSLRPKEDRFAFSAIFEMDANARILNAWFGRTVIHSNRRFTYEEAQERIETGEGDFAEEINLLNNFANKLRDRRFEHGAIAFETEEVRFRLDANGKPIGIYLKERKDAHMLVEDFMLLANRKVSERLSRQGKRDSPIPSVYRVHDEPDPEKLKNFEALCQDFGYEVKLPENPRELPKILNAFMKTLEGSPEQGTLSMMAVRSMAKAIYTTENIGHFGLGFRYYTHFTSPIRRYPDLMVHRLLAEALSKSKLRPDKAELEAQCHHSSLMERKAMDAEYESIRYKQAEFLSEQVGQQFEGRISGITKWGMYVMLLENRCEGMIRLESIGSEFVINERTKTLYDMMSDVTYRLGDIIKVEIKGVNLARREVDLDLVELPGYEEYGEE